jgi:AcrR family transcriptional regulator
MKVSRKDSAKTRQSLLAAASEVFVEKGYRNATVAEICERAGANNAAVNYHFRDKETLYRESWRHSFAESMKAHPPDGGVSESAPAEERLRGHIKAILNRSADQKNKDFLIFQAEITNPTGLLHEIMKAEMEPLREKTLALMREILGPHASDEQVRYCEICVVSMCINPMLVRRIDLRDGWKPPIIEDINAFAEHVVKFSLAGIAAIRAQI